MQYFISFPPYKKDNEGISEKERCASSAPFQVIPAGCSGIAERAAPAQSQTADLRQLSRR